MGTISKTKTIIFLFPALFLIIIILGGCSAGVQMNSSRSEKEIKIDGDPSEWSKEIEPIKDKKFSLGFKNDDKFLYLCLTTNDRSKLLLMARGGFIIWFVPESGDKNEFGIRYPMALDQSEEPPVPEMNREGMQGEKQGDLLAKMINKMILEQNEFQIVDKEKFPLTAFPILSNEGIEVKLGYHSNQFVYELKIPLQKNSQFPFAVETLPGGKVKIKFETEEFKFENTRGNRNMSEGETRQPRGGAGGRRGGSGGNAGMRQGMGGIGNSFEPIDYTVELKLSESIKK
ncbi:MAG: hypothetical protein NTX65_08180 [Ignavibacteriales bacterium]|nr:hypothetical protein [Ignavibacteriales bacterium]